jgi:exonuclease VII small subunit
MELQGRLEAALNQYRRAAHALGPNATEAEPLAQKLAELEEIVNELQRQRVQ